MIHHDYAVAVDPENLLKVKYVDPAQQIELTRVVLTCAYVPAIGKGGHRQVAIELVFDPAVPHPVVPYYSEPHHLQRLLIAPSALRGISPYL